MSQPEPSHHRLSGGPGYQAILTGCPETRGMRSGCVSLGPGEACGLHTTGKHEEVLVILEGRGAAQLAGERQFPLAAGEVFYVPPRTEHNVVAGEDGLRYVFVVAPVIETEADAPAPEGPGPQAGPVK